MASKDDPKGPTTSTAGEDDTPSREEALARLETMIDPPESGAKPRKPLQPALAREQRRSAEATRPHEADADVVAPEPRKPGGGRPSFWFLLTLVALPVLALWAAYQFQWISPPSNPAADGPTSQAPSFESQTVRTEAADRAGEPDASVVKEIDAIKRILDDVRTDQARLAEDVARLTRDAAELRAPQPAGGGAKATAVAPADLDAIDAEIAAVRIEIASLADVLRSEIDAAASRAALARSDTPAAPTVSSAAPAQAIQAAPDIEAEMVVLRLRLDRLEARQTYLNEHVLAGAIRNAPTRPIPGN